MKVRLDRLGDEPYAWQETLAFSDNDLEHPDVLALSEVGCSGRLSRTTPGILLEISLSYEQTLSCTRCLGDIATPVDIDLDLLVVAEDEEGREEEEERKLDEEDVGVMTLTGTTLDTRPLILEQIQLNVPMKSLCRTDCAGLCPECGADLNAGPCDCRAAADPRWAALARLKDRPGRRNS